MQQKRSNGKKIGENRWKLNQEKTHKTKIYRKKKKKKRFPKHFHNNRFGYRANSTVPDINWLSSRIGHKCKYIYAKTMHVHIPAHALVYGGKKIKCRMIRNMQTVHGIFKNPLDSPFVLSSPDISPTRARLLAKRHTRLTPASPNRCCQSHLRRSRLIAGYTTITKTHKRWCPR